MGSFTHSFVRALVFSVAIVAVALPYILVPINYLAAQDLSDGEDRFLLGDLGRKELSERGYTFEAISVHDFWGNVQGGLQRNPGILGALNVSLDVDTEKAKLWEDGQFFFYGLWFYGERPNNAVGDFQYTSNYDAPQGLELYQLWYAHNFLDDRVNVLFGIHDFTSEMGFVTTGFNLLNVSFAIAPATIIQIPGSFFPQTSIGARVKFNWTDELYSYLGVYDGRPGNIDRPRSMSYGISREGGLFSIGELGWQSDEGAERYGKVALGGWYSSATYNDLYNEERNSNFGSYLVAERQIFGEEGDSSQGLGVFMQLSQASASRNPISYYWGGGFAYTGLFECRERDVLSFGFNSAHSSGAARHLEDIQASAFERAIELNYRVKVNEYLSVTPDVQYIVNPGLYPDIDRAVVVSVRAEVAL